MPTKYKLKEGKQFTPIQGAMMSPIPAEKITDAMVEYFAEANPEQAAEIFEGLELKKKSTKQTTE
jgi:hypothetical protein